MEGHHWLCAARAGEGEMTQSFATQMYHARRRLKLSFRALERKIFNGKWKYPVTAAHLCHLEKGKSTPGRVLAIYIAEALEIDVDKFLIGAGHIPLDIEIIFGDFPKEACAAIRALKGVY